MDKKCYRNEMIKRPKDSSAPEPVYETPFAFTPAKGLNSLPLLITSPHSGAHYSDAFIEDSRLDAHLIRQSEDMYVDKLFDGAPALGAHLLAAHYPRAFVDLNRGENEIDPALVVEDIPSHKDQSLPRVQAGLGTIPSVVAEDTPIYDNKLSLTEIEARIRDIYKPFHRQMKTTLINMHEEHDFALLIDAHSMPSQAGRQAAPRNRSAQIDIVLGNCHGRSCDIALANFIGDHFTRAGYTVAHNNPYAGGYITSHYGRPENGFHAIQVEINRNLYMNEKTYEPLAGFDILKRDIDLLLIDLKNSIEDLTPQMLATRKAAE